MKQLMFQKNLVYFIQIKPMRIQTLLLLSMKIIKIIILTRLIKDPKVLAEA